MEEKQKCSTSGTSPWSKNLTPLLKNEVIREQCKSFIKKKDRNKNERYIKNFEVSQSNCTSENNLNLVINVELGKEQNYLDAYYTDFDLQSRKAFHESTKKHNGTNTLCTKFPELNLVFPEESNYYPCKANLNNDYNNRIKAPKDEEIYSAERNLNTTFQKYQENSDVEKFFNSKPNTELFANWSPFHFSNVKQMKPREMCYETIKQFNHQFTSNIQTNQELNNKNSNVNIDLKTRRQEEPPIPARKCNKDVTISNILPQVKSNSNHSIVQTHSINSFQNVSIVFSNPEIGLLQNRLECIYQRHVNSAISLPHKSSLLKFQTSNYNLNISSSIKEADSKLSLLECQKYDVYNFEDTVNIVQENSMRISSELQENQKKIKDLCYIQKKYNREQINVLQERKEDYIDLATSELSNVLKNKDSKLLNFDYYINNKSLVLMKSFEDICLESEALADDGQSQEMKCLETAKQNDVNENVPSKKKILEVIFPVKSMRVNTEIKNSALTDDIDLTNKASVKSAIEVEITQNAFQKGTVMVKDKEINYAYENEYKENDNQLNIKLVESAIVSKNDTCNHKINHENIDTVNMILNTKEFKKMVVHVIETYLKNDYLKDDDFEVIVVPKNSWNRKNLNPITALKELIDNQNECSSQNNLEGENEFPDLSMFNPRDFKGYTTKFDINIMEHNTAANPVTNQPKRKQLHHEHKNSCKPLRPGTGKGFELYTKTKKTVKKLNKYLSMPIFKIKNNKSSSNTNNVKPCQEFKPTYKEEDTPKFIVDNETPKISQKCLQYLLSDDISRDYSEYKIIYEKLRSKHRNKDLLNEFDEFKNTLEEIHSKENSLLNALNYDPCGLLYKFSKGNLVTKAK